MCKSEISNPASNHLRKILVSGLLFLAIAALCGVSVNAQGGRSTAVKPSATFEKVWVDYDMTEGGQKGMRIHLKFNVRGMKGVDSAVRIYFETKDGKRLRDNNKSFYTVGGDVALFRNLKVDYDPGYYEDLTLFMPYAELDLSAGEYDLKMDIDLIYKNGELIEHLTWYDFVFTQPAGNTTILTAPLPDPVEGSPAFDAVVTYDKTWIDYDVTENGKRGMRIHVKFTIENMKGVESYLRIRVTRKNGSNDEFLKSTNLSYSNDDGELSVSKKLKPGYDKAFYNDEKIFLPYEQIIIGRGEHNLKLDVDIVAANDELIKHMDLYEFVFRRQ